LSGEVRRRAVVREQGRRGQRDQRPVATAEQVLGEERGVVRAAPGGDQVTGWTLLAQPARDRFEGIARLFEEAPRHLRLLADLLAEAAHRRYFTQPPTMVRRTRRSRSS